MIYGTLVNIHTHHTRTHTVSK